MSVTDADAARITSAGIAVLPDVLPTTALSAASLPTGATQARPADGPPDGNGDGGATPSSPVSDDTQRQLEDTHALNALVDDLELHLQVKAAPDPVAGTTDVVRPRAVAVMQRVAEAAGEAMVYGPVAGARTSVSLLLRRALGLGPQAAVPAEAATILLERIMGLPDPYEVVRAVLRRRSLPEDQRQQLYAPGPDADDPLVQATLAALTGTDSPAPDQPSLRATTVGAAIRPNPVRFGEAFRSAMLKVRRGFSRFTGQFDKPSDEDGQLAHTIIGLHYIASHTDNPVIVDRFAWTPAYALLETLRTTAGNDSLFATVQTWLINATTGLVGQPDILDLRTREVYEIKPLHRIFEGAAQLGARYLLPLNTAVLGTEGLARKFIEALTPLGAASSAWQAPRPNLKLFLPGTQWRPSQVYPLPDGRFMFALLAVPGVIGYQILGQRKVEADGPSLSELGDRLFLSLAALSVLAAETLAAAPGDDQATGDIVLSPVGRRPIELVALRDLVLSIDATFATMVTVVVLFDLAAALAELLTTLLLVAVG